MSSIDLNHSHSVVEAEAGATAVQRFAGFTVGRSFRTEDGVPHEIHVVRLDLSNRVPLRHSGDNAANMITEILDVIVHAEPAKLFIIVRSFEIDPHRELDRAAHVILALKGHDITNLIVLHAQLACWLACDRCRLSPSSRSQT